MTDYALHDLDRLEAESLYILREVAAVADRPVLLYSAGKDSSVLTQLAQRAFAPAPIPFPLLHVDTSMKFDEMYAFRDETARRLGARLLVHRNTEALAGGASPWTLGTQRCCGLLKTRALLDALAEGGFDIAVGGARREEERSRAKERVFSVRDRHGQWDPRLQRPELWHLYNPRCGPGESLRVFPLSNWTELDVWRYIQRERIPVNPLYFARERTVVQRHGQLIPWNSRLPLGPGEQPRRMLCRFRTLGCFPCTGAVASAAVSVEDILAELLGAEVSERSTRVIDHDTDGSMEVKKREGYF